MDRTERDLIFALQAVQMGLLSKDVLVEVGLQWSREREPSLRELVVERAGLADEDLELVDRVVDRMLREHEGEARRTLERLGRPERVFESIRSESFVDSLSSPPSGSPGAPSDSAAGFLADSVAEPESFVSLLSAAASESAAVSESVASIASATSTDPVPGAEPVVEGDDPAAPTDPGLAAEAGPVAQAEPTAGEDGATPPAPGSGSEPAGVAPDQEGEQAVPGEAAPGQGVADQVAPEQAVPGQAVPGQAAPGQAAPEQAAPAPALDPALAASAPAPVEADRGDSLEERVTLQQSGRYRIRGEHGRGGIGRVLEAFDEHVGREIAIKELIPHDKGDSGPQTPAGKPAAVAARFLREARVTGQLEHPNIVPVYEVGRRDDGTLYYTMKLVRGKTLAQTLRSCRSLEERLRLLPHYVALCQAIAYAHSRGVIHRDIKTGNVMLGEFGETVVLDWGLAKVRGQQDIGGGELEQEIRLYRDEEAGKTVDGRAIGTPAYMSPEQAEGEIEAIDERSDVWSLGAVLYEILTGRPPFEGVNAFEVIGKVLSERVTPPRQVDPTIPPELASVCEKALRRSPSRRYAGAQRLAEEVEAYQSGARVTAYEYSSWELLKRFVARNRALSAASLLLLVVLIATSGVIFWAYRSTDEARQSELRARLEAERALTEWKSAVERTRVVSRQLAQAYQATAEREIALRDFMSALIYVAAALRHHPDNPQSRFYAPSAPPRAVANGIGLQGRGRAPPRGRRRAARGGEPRSLPQGLGLPAAVERAVAGVAAAERAVAGVAAAGGGEGNEGDIGEEGDEGEGDEGDAGDEGAGDEGDEGDEGAIGDEGDEGGDGGAAGAGGAGPRRVAAAMASTGGVGSGRGPGPRPGPRPRPASEPAPRPAGPAGCQPDEGSAAGRGPRVPCRDRRLESLLGLQSILFSVRTQQRVTRQAELVVEKGRPLYALGFSPSGALLAAGGADGSLVLWSVKQRRVAGRLDGHGKLITAVAFSPEGRYLAVGGSDQVVHLWDVSTRKEVARLEGHGDAVLGLAFSPDGRWLASASKDKTVRLWHVAQRREVTVLTAHEDTVFAVAFDPRGRTLASAGSDRRIRLWSVTVLAGGGPARPRATLRGHEGSIFSLSFTPDGRLLASAGEDRTLRLWDVRSARPLSVLRGHDQLVRAVACGPRGRLLASVSFDQTVRIWGVQERRVVAKLRGHGKRVDAVAFSPDGRVVASAGRDGAVRLWRVDPEPPVIQLTGHRDLVEAVAVSPDGERLASASYDRTVGLWDLEKRALVRRLKGHRKAVLAVAFSPDGQTVASAGRDRGVRLWRAADGEALGLLRGHRRDVNSLAFLGPGRLASASSDGTVRLWDLERQVARLVLEGHRDEVYDVAVDPEGRRVATTSFDKTIRIWDARSGRPLRVLSGPPGYAFRLAWSPDGRHLAAARQRTESAAEIELWDVRRGRRVRRLPGHRRLINSLAYSPDGSLLLSGSKDHTVRLWEPATGRLAQVLEHSRAVSAVRFLPDGRRFVANDWKTIRVYPLQRPVWRLDPDALLRRAQREAGLVLEEFNLRPAPGGGPP
jgi:WD40 repeat protein/serine/threonine protein kinase